MRPALAARACAVVACLTAVIAAPATAEAATCLPGRQAALLVSYSRTGGLAGIRDELRVARSGRATLQRTRGGDATFRLSCPRLRALRNALVRARFATLARVYAPADPISDGLVESVAYGGRRVDVLTGARPPERLARVLGLLRDIVAKRRFALHASG